MIKRNEWLFSQNSFKASGGKIPVAFRTSSKLELLFCLQMSQFMLCHMTSTCQMCLGYCLWMRFTHIHLPMS